MQNKDEELVEDAKLLVKAITAIHKRYNEARKLNKQQKTLNENTPPLFICHAVVKKQFVVSYVQLYNGVLDELNFDGLVEFVNPDVYKNGVLVVSKYQASMNADESYAFNNTNNDIYEDPNNETLYFTESSKVTSRIEELVNCGTIFSSKEIYAVGKKEYHGSLGLIKKVFLNLSELKPLSIFEAKYFGAVHVTALNQQLDSTSLLTGKAVVIQCEPKVPKKITYLILFPEEKTLRIMQVTEVDPMSKGQRLFKSKPEEVTYSATYDILSDLKLESTQATRISSEETLLRVSFYWCGSGKQIELQPPHSAKVVLQVKIALGEPQSALNEIFLELTTLDGIGNCPASDNSGHQISADLDKMYESLAEFKETVSDFSFYGNIENQAGQEDNADLEKPMSQLIQQSFQRKDYDFTDKLWMFLIRNDGIEEMKSYLDDILNDIVHGSLQPAVSPINNTKLAKLIRKMYLEEQEENKVPIKEKILEFLSNDQSVANFIVEIGFEKMKKDYFNFFLSKELTLLPNLQRLHKQQPMGSIQGTTDISLLWKLHYCLEIVTTPTIYLRIDHDCQRSLLSAALEYYSRTDVIGLSSPIFCFSLLPVQDSSSLLFDTCETRQPKLWKQASLKINNIGSKESNILRVVNKELSADDDMDMSISETAKKQEQMLLREEIIVLP